MEDDNSKKKRKALNIILGIKVFVEKMDLRKLGSSWSLRMQQLWIHIFSWISGMSIEMY